MFVCTSCGYSTTDFKMADIHFNNFGSHHVMMYHQYDDVEALVESQT